jgi:hypothetical protein
MSAKHASFWRAWGLLTLVQELACNGREYTSQMVRGLFLMRIRSTANKIRGLCHVHGTNLR